MSLLRKGIYNKMMIKYKDPQGNIIEVEGRLFVCKSKNGKDVFVGDIVSFVPPSHDRRCTSLIEWADGGAVVAASNSYFPYLGECSDIELIEDKDNGTNIRAKT